MLNKKNNMYKIAVIDKEKAIYSILDEQKEFFINYTWFHFKSIKKFTEIKNKETFRIYLIDETVITQDTFNSYILKHFKELVPCLFILSPNNRFKDRLSNNLFMPLIAQFSSIGFYLAGPLAGLNEYIANGIDEYPFLFSLDGLLRNIQFFFNVEGLDSGSFSEVIYYTPFPTIVYTGFKFLIDDAFLIF